MRTEKWQMYLGTLQGHPSICQSSHTVESMNFITNYIPPEDFPRMLDIGCGEGLEADVLRKLGYDVVGLTQGKVNVEYAQKYHPDVKILEMDMHDLKFPSESFDAAYLNHVFEHSFAPFFLLVELYCVLKDGGRVWIATPHFKEKDDPTVGESNLISHHHPNMLSHNLFCQFFEKTGFKVLQDEFKEGTPYFDNPYLLEKQSIDVLHSDVRTAVLKRKELFGGKNEIDKRVISQ